MGKNSRKSGEKLEEQLRGKIRELQKEIRKKDQYIRQLENRGPSKSKVKEEKSEPSKVTCPNCGKGDLETFSYPRRGTSPLVVIACSLCEYKVKRNEGR